MIFELFSRTWFFEDRFWRKTPDIYHLLDYIVWTLLSGAYFSSYGKHAGK